MRVEKSNYERTCDECGEFADAFEITLADGYTQMVLCKDCLMKLLKAIIER